MGISGVLDQDFIDLTNIPERELDDVALMPGSELKAKRDKPDERTCREIIKVLDAYGITQFVYIGGDDTVKACAGMAKALHPTTSVRSIVHVIKTIDNDIAAAYVCPGHLSAAQEIAEMIIRLNLDNRSMPGVHLSIIMGREAGWLTAAAKLGGAHLLCLPERNFVLDKFLTAVKAVYERHGRCIVAVSEGIHGPDGKAIAEIAGPVRKDAFGNAELSGSGTLGDFLRRCLEAELGVKVRAEQIGYGARASMRQIPFDIEIAEQVGIHATAAAMGGMSGSISVQRYGSLFAYPLLPFEEVAGKKRYLESKMLKAGPFHVSDAFDEYLQPMLAPLPRVHHFSAPAVPKLVIN